MDLALGHLVKRIINIKNYFSIFKGANRYQKVVGQNGVGKGILGLLPRMYF